MPVTRPFLSGEVLLPVQPYLHSAVRGCGRPVDDPREARSNDRAGRRDLEPPVRFRGSPVFPLRGLRASLSRSRPITSYGITAKYPGRESNLRCFSCNGFTVRPPRRWSYRPISSKQSFSLILRVSRDSSCKHDCSRTPCCNKKPPAWNSPNRRPEICVSSDDTHECLCFIGAFPHDNKTLLLSRRDR